MASDKKTDWQKTEVDTCWGNLYKLLAKTFQSKSDLREVMLKDSLKIKSLDFAMFLNHIHPKIAKNLMFVGKTQCVLLLEPYIYFILVILACFKAWLAWQMGTVPSLFISCKDHLKPSWISILVQAGFPA